jgi:nicotinamidase-related amidase
MASDTAVLVIDVQVGLIDGAHEPDALLRNIADLIERARKASVPIVYLQHNHSTWAPLMAGAPTWQIHPRVAPKPGDIVIGKRASDGFYETTLQAELERLGVRRLIVTGMQTEYCVDSTCRSALSRDFDVTLATDAHTTGDSDLPAATVIAHHNAALPNIAHPTRRIAAHASAAIRFDARN